MSLWQDTLTKLNEQAANHDAVLVGFSGGKDSLICLDLCRRSFKKVVCFYMYVVPGLDCIEQQMEAARKRWNVEIIYVPHFLLFRFLKGGIFCDESLWKDDHLQDVVLKDIYSWVKQMTGIRLICTGAKNSDSLWRRRHFHAVRNWDGMLYPLKEWNKYHVLEYLKVNNIPLPDSEGTNAAGIDLSTPSLLWLYDKHPEDFKKLLKWFPFADAVVARRTFYGIGEKKENEG